MGSSGKGKPSSPAVWRRRSGRRSLTASPPMEKRRRLRDIPSAIIGGIQYFLVTMLFSNLVRLFSAIFRGFFFLFKKVDVAPSVLLVEVELNGSTMMEKKIDENMDKKRLEMVEIGLVKDVEMEKDGDETGKSDEMEIGMDDGVKEEGYGTEEKKMNDYEEKKEDEERIEEYGTIADSVGKFEKIQDNEENDSEDQQDETECENHLEENDDEANESDSEQGTIVHRDEESDNDEDTIIDLKEEVVEGEDENRNDTNDYCSNEQTEGEIEFETSQEEIDQYRKEMFVDAEGDRDSYSDENDEEEAMDNAELAKLEIKKFIVSMEEKVAGFNMIRVYREKKMKARRVTVAVKRELAVRNDEYADNYASFGILPAKAVEEDFKDPSERSNPDEERTIELYKVALCCKCQPCMVIRNELVYIDRARFAECPCQPCCEYLWRVDYISEKGVEEKYEDKNEQNYTAEKKSPAECSREKLANWHAEFSHQFTRSLQWFTHPLCACCHCCQIRNLFKQENEVIKKLLSSVNYNYDDEDVVMMTGLAYGLGVCDLQRCNTRHMVNQVFNTPHLRCPNKSIGQFGHFIVFIELQMKPDRDLVRSISGPHTIVHDHLLAVDHKNGKAYHTTAINAEGDNDSDLFVCLDDDVRGHMVIHAHSDHSALMEVPVKISELRYLFFPKAYMFENTRANMNQPLTLLEIQQIANECSLSQQERQNFDALVAKSTRDSCPAPYAEVYGRRSAASSNAPPTTPVQGQKAHKKQRKRRSREQRDAASKAQ